jgi:tetratricopeptide (TPR) repeat protein
LGVVLFEMLTGQVPFTADTPFATVHDHIYTPLPLPTSINPGLDPAVERMLLKALAKDPADRYATVGELQAGLEASLGAQIAAPPVAAETIPSPSPSAETNVDRSKKQGTAWWVWAGGAALVLLILAGLLVGLLLLRRASRNQSLPPDQPVPAQASDSQSDQPPPPPADEINQGGSDPNSPEHRRAAELAQEAGLAMQQRNLDEAIDLYNQALEIDPSYLPAYFGLAEALRQSGDQVASQAVLEDAVAQNPDNPATYRRLGEFHLLAEEFEQALSAFEQAVALDPDDPALLAEQGIALLGLDEDEAAKEAIDAALQLDQFSPEARLANAIYLIKQREFRPAALTLRELAHDPRAPLFVQVRARRLLEKIKPE